MSSGLAFETFLPLIAMYINDVDPGIYLFSKYLLRAYCMPDTDLDAGDTVNKLDLL